MIDINEPHPNLGCEVCDDNDHCLPRWEDDGGENEPAAVTRAGVSRRTPNVTMDTMIGHPTDSVINRSEDLTASGGAGAGRVVRPSGLTSRDIEAEALVRLARRGYDWSGTLRRGRKTP